VVEKAATIRCFDVFFWWFPYAFSCTGPSVYQWLNNCGTIAGQLLISQCVISCFLQVVGVVTGFFSVVCFF